MAAATAATALDLRIGTALADAGSFTNENLTSPGPDRLIAPGKNRDLSSAARSNPDGQPPPADAGHQEAMRHRLRTPEAAATCQRRSAAVEPVIAHLKGQVGLRRFSSDSGQSKIPVGGHFISLSTDS